MSTTPEVIVAGALATKASNIAPSRYAAEMIAGGQPVHYVHGGVPNENGDLYVATPSQQEHQITRIIEGNPTQSFVILSQSMGALAALSCVEKFNTPRVNAISIAPPLLYPSDVIRHPRITTMSKISNGRLILPSRSFALGDNGPTRQRVDPSELPDPLQLTVPTALFDEIDEANLGYWGRTVAAVEKGSLKIIMPTEDWNKAALESARDLPTVHYLDGPHSLINDAATLQKNIAAIARLAQQFDTP